MTQDTRVQHSDVTGEEIQALQAELGYLFKNSRILHQALTHKSVSVDGDLNNEKLEFLGDAVLGLFLADVLMREHPQEDEGFLSKKRASLANEGALAMIATQLRLGERIRLGKGELATAGDRKPRLLASCLEAIFGAIYLDGGILSVFEVVERLFLPLIRSEQDTLHDYKSKFQEIVQAESRVTPIYQLVNVAGPSHAPLFRVAVEIAGEVMAHGEGSSKKSAEQAAAKLALEKLSESNSESNSESIPTSISEPISQPVSQTTQDRGIDE